MNGSRTRKLNASATLASIGALVCWCSGPLFIKFLTGYLDLWTQNMLRYLVACLFWLPYLLFSLRNKRIDRRLWLRGLLPAAANTLMQCFWAGAFYYLKPAFMVLLAQSSLIWIAGFSILFFRQERPLLKSKRFWVGALCSVTGVLGVLFFKHDFAAAKTLTGIAIALLAAFFWGVYTICAKIAFRDFDSRIGFSVMSGYTVVGLFSLALIFGRPQDCIKLPVCPWASVVISGILSIALSHVLYYSAIKRIGATIPSLVLLLQPFLILAASSVVFDEFLNVFQWIFGLILIFGSALAILAQQHLGPVLTDKPGPGKDK
ncbi:MAG: DMT family transporter [Planctomycetota bacterium]|jgi:drug/metabolite transporter (DMT)-like permease